MRWGIFVEKHPPKQTKKPVYLQMVIIIPKFRKVLVREYCQFLNFGLTIKLDY